MVDKESTNKISFEKPLDPNTYIESKRMDLESGWLGKVFGTGNNSNINIAGLIAIMLILPALFFTFFNLQTEDKTTVLEFWKIITPLVGTILGYLFGSSSSKLN